MITAAEVEEIVQEAGIDVIFTVKTGLTYTPSTGKVTGSGVPEVTIGKTFTEAGVAYDPDSVSLSDPTETYGVKRTDDDTVIVANGVALTQIASGSYETTFTEPDSDLQYSVWLKWIINGETFREGHTFTGTAGLYASTDYTVKAVPPYEFKDQYIQGDTTSYIVAKILISSEGLQFTPLKGQQVTVDGTLWDIYIVEPIITKYGRIAYVLHIRMG